MKDEPAGLLDDSEAVPALSSTTILDIALSTLPGTTISIAESGTAEHFRLINCDAFLDFAALRVVQYDHFTPKRLHYAAVSYPWRDLQLPEDTPPPLGCFSVEGAESADAITIGVLRTACIAARQFGVSLLWVDRLCIMQTSKPDKRWQIQRMFTVYVHANPCLVLPGGLVRLAHLDEPTTWVDRAWTLQEAAANVVRDAVKCVFAFPHTHFSDFARALPRFDSYSPVFRNYLTQSDHSKLTQHTIEPGYSAACDLLALFSAMMFMSETLEFNDPDIVDLYMLYNGDIGRGGPCKIGFRGGMKEIEDVD